MDDKFKIKSYGYGELAQMYFPSISKKSASIQLSKWLKLNANLKSKLQSVGFKSGQKILTPKQVDIIISFIGEP
jgi:hypothetical protein